MDDRTLLELAAKAAGVRGIWCDAGLNLRTDAWPNIWSPLTDDGDALRLAVKRRFHINIFSATDADGINTPGFVEIWDDGNDPICVEWINDADYEKATRRAIVRAAAELGRQTNGN